MKKTLIVMSSNREMEKQTLATVNALAALGAARLMEVGSSDVAFARCRALSFACEHLRNMPERDVVLMLDDDMEVPSSTAQAVVDHARTTGKAGAAAYATITAKLAATRWKDGLWMVGLGCVAIPRALLLELEASSDSFELNGKAYTAFTWSAAEKGVWVAEDYRLSQRLGGVHLLPLGVGHIKKGSLWPDDETLALIAKGGPVE